MSVNEFIQEKCESIFNYILRKNQIPTRHKHMEILFWYIIRTGRHCVKSLPICGTVLVIIYNLLIT